MKNIFKYSFPLIFTVVMTLVSLVTVVSFTLSLSSCHGRDDANGGRGGEGTVRFNFEMDASTVDLTSRGDGGAVYSVEIVNKAGEVVKQYDDHRLIPSELRLSAGDYVLKAVSALGAGDVIGVRGAVPAAQFDVPIYGGEAAFTVVAGGEVGVEVVCTLVTTKVTVGFSQVIKDNFTSYSVEVTNDPYGDGAVSNGGDGDGGDGLGGSLIFGASEVADGRSGYFAVNMSSATVEGVAQQAMLKWTLRLVNVQGDSYEFNHIIYDVKARDHYMMNFDIEAAGPGTEIDGSSSLSVVVSDKVDIIEHNYGIVLDKGPKPTFVGDGFDVNAVVLVNEQLRGVRARVNLDVACGMQDLTLRHYSSTLEMSGVPRVMNLLAMPQEDITLLNGKGLFWSAWYNATSGWVDFSEMANVLPLGEYVFDIVSYDAQRQEVTQRIVFNVLPDTDHQPVSAEPMAKFAVMRGQWNTLTLPAGLTFEYATQAQVDAGEAWSRVDQSLVVFEGDANGVGGKGFSARVTNLEPNAKYHYRTYADTGVGKIASTFSTESAPEIPNLSFDESYKSGKTWYFNASGGNSFWGTGNEGLNATLAGGWDSNTVRVEGADAVSGGAVRMTSWGGVPVVKHAAGNLFTGSFSLNITSPSTSVKFGRPYTGRPLGLNGWYRYKTTPITVNAGSHGGENDQCHIYISLENWGGSGSRPGDRIVVGYGEFKTDQNVDVYTPFSFDIEYYRRDIMPTHIVMTATSSIYGGDFCGGNGSELFVDEFELIWQ